jgi:hypothetical protein
MSNLIGKRIAKKTWACATYAKDRVKISLLATGKISIFISYESGKNAMTNHTPAQAREIAAELIRLADEIEGKNAAEWGQS